MKYLLSIMIAGVVAGAAAGEVRVLDCRAGVPVDVEADVWDFSGAERVRPARARYDSYGDSLVSEIVDGRRRWFACRDGVYTFVREETSLMCVDAENEVPTAAFAPQALTVQCAMRMAGTYSGSMFVSETGEYRCLPARRGVLVRAEGDSVAATMTADERVFTARIADRESDVLTEEGSDTLSRYEVRVYRWFDGQALPVAVQTDVALYSPSGRLEDSAVATYIAGRGESGDDDADEAAADDAAEAARRIGAATANFDGRSISVSVPGADAIEIHVDVTDQGGVLYAHAEGMAGDGVPLEIARGGMPAGRYIVAVTSPSAPLAVTKRLVVI